MPIYEIVQTGSATQPSILRVIQNQYFPNQTKHKIFITELILHIHYSNLVNVMPDT